MNLPSKKTISVVICALNEEKNIGLLLNDILEQKVSPEFEAHFMLKRILVVSDGSIDTTADIAREYMRKDSRVELIENPQRIGKIFSLNKAFNHIDEDYAVLFDADVRLETNTIDRLAVPFITRDYDLIGGNPVPYKPESIFNIAEHASLFSWLLVQRIKTAHPLSIYSAHGRILMLSKKLYKELHIDELSTPGDDQYIYLKANHNFCYQKSAEVRYRMPASSADYLKQNVRFRTAKQMRGMNTATERIDEEFKVENKFSVLLATAVKHPYNFFWWVILYTIGYAKFALQFKGKKNNDFRKVWGEVTSTK